MRFLSFLFVLVAMRLCWVMPCQAQALATQGTDLKTLPILLPDVQPKPGFYYSLLEFQYNQPGEPGQPDVEARPYLGTEWAGDQELKPYHLDASGKRVLASAAWGFCDGRDFYIRYGTGFYRLLRQGPNFAFYGRTGNSAGVHAALSVLAIGLLASGAAAAPVSSSAEHRVLYYLELLTGTVSLTQPLLPPVPGSVVMPAHVFIYRPHSAKGPAARIQLAGGQPEHELAAGDFLSLFPEGSQALKVCLLPATSSSHCLPLSFQAGSTIYLECRPDAPTPLRAVADNEGRKAITRLAK